MRFLSVVALLCCQVLVGLAVAGSERWPEGLAFLGNSGAEWRIWYVPEGHDEPIELVTDEPPADFAYSAARREVAYVDVGGSLRLRELDSGSETIFSALAEGVLAQPAYMQDDRIIAVLLKKGSSQDTDIVARRLDRANFEAIVSQRSSQFEPFVVGRTLLYSHVACVRDCGRIVQDIWRKDLVTGQAEQITRMNAIAREPVMSPDGEWVYFSSNKSGNFHIWRVRAGGAEPEQLTHGPVTDTSARFAADGQLYFVRRTIHGSALMRLNPEGETRAMQLPDGIRDIRSLKDGR